MNTKSICRLLIAAASVLLIVGVNSCNTLATKEERLARKYCGACHLFPDPSLLDKRTWNNTVLPQMAFRMGYKDSRMIARISPADLPFVLQTIPSQPMITEDEFALIRKYYSKNAPDFLFFDDEKTIDSIKQFKAYPAPFQIPFITLLKFDSLNQALYIGTRSSELYKLTNSLQVVDSIPLESPATHASFKGDRLLISLVGMLLPNDQSKGKLVSVDGKMEHVSPILDSLKRFVFFEAEDLNQDEQDDFIVCAFGHYSGALKVFESKENSYIEHT